MFMLVVIIATFGASASAKQPKDKLNEMTPEILERLNVVREVLMPVPKDLLAEALFTAASYYIPIDSESQLCRNHSNLLFNAFLDNELWALKMVDASSKIGPGFLDGHFMDLGSYGECVSVTAPGEQFKGQHCVVETRGLLPLKMDYFNPQKGFMAVLRTDVTFSLCVPSSCTAQDVKAHVDVTLSSVNASAILNNSSCSSAIAQPFTKADYFAIFVIVIIALSVIFSTWYENRPSKIAKHPIMTSFSLMLNTRKLLEPENKSDSLSCLNGLRVLAISWVVLGHRLLHQLRLPNLRFRDYLENLDSLSWAPMQEVPLPVEVFFLLSGLLLTYNFLKDRNKEKTFNYISFVARRYRRLTPPLALMVLLYATIAIHFTDGPIWKRTFSSIQERCQKNWLTTLTYTANYLNPYGICIGQSWYLTVDFQLHLLSPLLLFPLYKHQLAGLLCLGVAFLATTVAALAQVYVLEIPGTGYFREDLRRAGDWVPTYVKTHYRGGSFLMGIVLGLFVFKIKHQQLSLKLSKVKLWTGWITSVCLIVSSTYCVVFFVGPDYHYSQWVDPWYYVLHRYTLSLGVAWVILVCTTNNEGLVNRILSWNMLLPLSRLSYGVYLVHYLLQDIQSLRTRSVVTIDTFTIWYLFFADILFSFIVAAVLFLTVESPINNVLNHIFREKSSKNV